MLQSIAMIRDAVWRITHALTVGAILGLKRKKGKLFNGACVGTWGIFR